MGQSQSYHPARGNENKLRDFLNKERMLTVKQKRIYSTKSQRIEDLCLLSQIKSTTILDFDVRNLLFTTEFEIIVPSYVIHEHISSKIRFQMRFTESRECDLAVNFTSRYQKKQIIIVNLSFVVIFQQKCFRWCCYECSTQCTQIQKY